MLRVLLITREPWRDASNEGSVLSSWFDDQPMELAQIYCKPDMPDSRCCKRFFQLTDKMAVKNLLKREPMGAVIDPANQIAVESTKTESEKKTKSFYDFFRRHNWASFFLAQEILWSLANWKSKALEDFVDEFAPDVIVAPLCYSRYVMAIQRWVAKRSKKPMVGVVWDDLYSLNQWHISPIYWLNRLIQRHFVKKTVNCCESLYSLSPQQAETFGNQFKREFGVLPKAGMLQQITSEPDEKCVRFIYAGGIYYGRINTLSAIVEALAHLNKEGFLCQLDVYSNSLDAPSLTKPGVCQVYEAISADELRKSYAASHVAIHAEGYDRTNVKIMRCSFSSKIVDCLSSGCAVLVACPTINCGCRYLLENEAAICAEKPDQIAAKVELLVKDAELRNQLKERANACMQANHSPEAVKALVYQQLNLAAQKKHSEA